MRDYFNTKEKKRNNIPDQKRPRKNSKNLYLYQHDVVRVHIYCLYIYMVLWAVGLGVNCFFLLILFLFLVVRDCVEKKGINIEFEWKVKWIRNFKLPM